MYRRLAIVIAMLLSPYSCSAASAAWTCKPVWKFSGMGNKSYQGSGVSETAAKDLARKSCVVDNRGLELDDFCLPEPNGNDWHCTQDQQQQTINSAPLDANR
ncbi:MAG: hypothetical protein QM780_08870 [Hyphomicrobium sp.]|uniref:hypothetical protein n=1 Tax=Hyphomicrobium sp. TaxID=82 RepID=UPI0039E50E1F